MEVEQIFFTSVRDNFNGGLEEGCNKKGFLWKNHQNILSVSDLLQYRRLLFFLVMGIFTVVFSLLINKRIEQRAEKELSLQVRLLVNPISSFHAALNRDLIARIDTANHISMRSLCLIIEKYGQGFTD